MKLTHPFLYFISNKCSETLEKPGSFQTGIYHPASCNTKPVFLVNRHYGGFMVSLIRRSRLFFFIFLQPLNHHCPKMVLDSLKGGRYMKFLAHLLYYTLSEPSQWGGNRSNRGKLLTTRKQKNIVFSHLCGPSGTRIKTNGKFKVYRSSLPTTTRPRGSFSEKVNREKWPDWNWRSLS